MSEKLQVTVYNLLAFCSVLFVLSVVKQLPFLG